MESAGAGQPPPGSAALRYATVVLPDELGRERALARLSAAGIEPRMTDGGALLHDPSGNSILLVSPGERVEQS